MPSRTTGRRSRSTARVATTGAVVLVVLAVGGVTAFAATRGGGARYRTAVVSTQAVSQTLQAVGTVQPSTSATVSFPVSGTVASVLVTVGQPVAAGQRLATLATTSLTYAVAQAKAQLASAQLTLYDAETGQSASAGSGRATTPSSGGSSSGSSAAVAAAQKRLLAAQRQLDSALSRTRRDLALATTLCAGGPSPTPTPSPAAPPAPGPAPTTCAQAQAAVLTDEQQVLAQEQSLAGQVQALDRLLASAGATSSRAGSGGGSSSTASGATAVSAAQLAADQAQVDAAQAALAVAEQGLAQATIVSPMAGTVSDVGLTVGSTATAGSSSSAVTVIGSTHVVTVAVDVSRIAQVAVGQQGTVVPDGGGPEVEATVTRVGVAPTTTGGTSYAVTLALTGDVAGLRDGTQASVTLETRRADKAVSVPTSAVRHVGALTVVTVLDGSATSTVRVTLGAVGPVFTEVTQGLRAGQVVVLADLDEPVPTSSTTPRLGGGVGRQLGGIGSGLTGGGLGAGSGPVGRG